MRREAGGAGPDVPVVFEHVDDVRVSAEEGRTHQAAGADHRREPAARDERAHRKQPSQRQDHDDECAQGEEAGRDAARSQQFERDDGDGAHACPEQP